MKEFFMKNPGWSFLIVLVVCLSVVSIAEFNRLRTTTIREATCRDCLEWAFQQKRKELNEIAKKLGDGWEV